MRKHTENTKMLIWHVKNSRSGINNRDSRIQDHRNRYTSGKSLLTIFINVCELSIFKTRREHIKKHGLTKRETFTVRKQQGSFI